MADQLHLPKSFHNLLVKRKATIEAKFKVKINPFFTYTQEPKNGYSDSSRTEICVDTLVGEISDIEAVRHYINEVFVKPEIINIVSYHQDLGEAIFQNNVWIDIFEELFIVCITSSPDCELHISGSEACVTSAVKVLDELIATYYKCKNTSVVNSDRSPAHKLVAALLACKNVCIPTTTFDAVPNGVIHLLLSLLEKAYKESFPVFDELEDSVLIIEPPEKEADISVIVLDSDLDSDSNSKRPLESSCTENAQKKKKKRLREKKKRKKSRALENTNGQQGGGDLPNQSERENGKLQYPKKENCVDKSKLPKIEDPNFIPLSLDSANANSSASEIPSQQAVQPPEEVVVEDIPEVPRQLRPIIIDGCNVAFYATQGRREDFSWKRIEISLNYFLTRGHDVKVFLPQYRRPICYEKSGNQDHVENLETKHLIIFTPSRRIDGRTVSCYDDRFMVDLASRNGGIIFSNDNYRDLINENPDFAKTIKERLLMYIFVGDELMIPEDPLGKNGPRLDDFLSFPAEK